jgi:hypothetical protein
MRKVKSYTQFILEKDGGALASDAVSALAKFINPGEKKKRTQEEVEQSNPDLSSLVSGGWKWDDEQQGYLKISDVLCGRVLCVPGGPYRILSGPNKGKVGLWKGSGVDVIFQPPTGISSISELEGPDEEFVKEKFPGIDYYINGKFITVKYKTETSPFYMEYHDMWQTYGDVKIEYDNTKRAFKWQSISGPNSSFKGEGLYWAGTEEKASSMTWTKSQNRNSKGKSLLEAGILAPWTLRDSGTMSLSPVEFESLKKGESKEISKGRHFEYCEDPYHFMYLTMPSGIIKEPDSNMFKKQWHDLLLTHFGGKDNVKWDTTEIKNKGSFRLTEGINGFDTVLFTLDCKNELPVPGKNMDGDKANLYYGNLGFFFKDNDGKLIKGEWYWNFADGKIGIVRCYKENAKNIIKIAKKSEEKLNPEVFKTPYGGGPVNKEDPGTTLLKMAAGTSKPYIEGPVGL